MLGKYEDKVYTAICSEKTLQSNEKGFFMQFVENVQEEVGQDWIQNTFGTLKSDKERIRKVYEYEPLKTVVFDTLSRVQEIYRQKSADVSQSRRRLAEQALKNGEIQKALILYSQSILRSPPTGENKAVDDGKSLSLGFWGRSQVFATMNEYNFALSDIQTALKENIFDSYKAQAFWKMGVCYKAVGEVERSKVAFGVAEKLLQNNEGALRNLKKDMEKDYKQNSNQFKKSLPKVSGKSHPKLPNASSKICIKQAKGLGRFVAAQEAVQTGDILTVEPPYAACLLPECFGTHCHHCFDRLIAPVGCPTCCSIAFCGNDCRNIAVKTYHSFECKYLDLLIGSGMSILAHTALRMITQNNLEKILKIYENKDLELVYSLCTNSELRRPEDFFQRTLMACFLLRCLQKCGYFPYRRDDDCTPSEDELKVAELLLLHLQILQFNAHEIYESKCSTNHRFKGVKAGYIGVAVYPTSSYFNHSCYPGVTRYFVGKNIILTATRPINPGEIIPENYGPVFTRRNLVERQKSLSSRYWFVCECIACIQNWPSLDKGLDNVSRKVRCPTQRCTYYFVLPVENDTIKCPKCKKNVCLTENIVRLKNCEEQLKEAGELMEKQDAKNGIRLLQEAIDVFHKVSVPPHRDIHLGQELLRTFLAEAGNVHVVAQ
ncbi:set and mynd domain-containing protein 4 [Holotrichia oblita]|uniref:Set and mynd domain-containing protein 4 n=1 Tax=Holotrichia oblita TaxID=644536 RepID=A0ACB9SPJ9_HOLOL|nr:set and mynd domain-containing protein 4 [Holotrichia oblita]